MCAHWDTRPFADQDSINKNKPIIGANDGASGVGVLIEIARQFSILKPKIGVDIIFLMLKTMVNQITVIYQELIIHIV